MNRIGSYSVFLIFAMLLFSTNALADKGQPSTKGFTWADSQHVLFDWIEISADPSVTQLSTPPDDDTLYTVNLPVDFSFNFYNRNFSTFYVSENGYLTFRNYGTTSSPSNNDLSASASIDSLIAVFWDSLRVGTTGNIYYAVKGTKPYRKAIIEFQDVTVVAPTENLGPITFEVILYETTNLIKLQYLDLGSLSIRERGGSATIGLKFEATTFDSLQYSVNTTSLSEGLAILFYPSDNLLTNSAISPAVVAPGTSQQSFKLSFTAIQFQLLADSLERMGKADVVSIKNPINKSTTDPITVTDVRVDGNSFFIMDTIASPRQLGLEGPYATWYYDNATDSLFIRTSTLAIRDSITIEFQEDIPTTPKKHEFKGLLYAEYHPLQGISFKENFNIIASVIDHYVFTPAGVDTFRAGVSKAFVLQAQDQYNNPVTNSQSVNLSSIGSSTVMFSRGTTVPFANSDTIMFSVSDTVAEDFRVLAENATNSNVTGLSGVQTVLPATPFALVTLSSTAPITVSTSRLLQVRVEDQYGNVHPDSSLKFKKVSAGDGQFSNGLDSIIVLTNSSGVGEATYTASSLTSYVGDTIQVSLGSLVDTIILPLQAGNIASYQFSPSTAQGTTAGTGVSFTLTAVDVNGNPVVNSQQVVLTALGGTGVTFSPNDTLTYSNQSSVTFTVTDTVAETFYVLASNLSGSITKQSPSITVSPATPSSFIVLSATDSITVGTSRPVSVRLEDIYGNVHPDSLILFTLLNGNGKFTNQMDTIFTRTNSNGVAEVTYRASTKISFLRDSIQVSLGTSVIDTILIPLKASVISNFHFTVLGTNPDTAGSKISIQVKAVDVYNNGVVNSQTYQVTTIGSNTARFLLPGQAIFSNFTFSNDSLDTVVVRDTVSGSFVVKARLSTDTTRQGVSPEIQILPASLAQLRLRSLAGNKGTLLSNIDSTFASTSSMTFYAAGYDRFGNYINDIDSTVWQVATGNLKPSAPITFPYTNFSLIFDPDSVGTGRLYVSIPTSPSVGTDTTGVLTVTTGPIASVKIQSDSTDASTEVGARTFIAGQSLTMYAVGYDADNNRIANVSSNWTLNNSNLGSFDNGLPTFNGTKQVTFTAEQKGAGVVSAAVASNTTITDQTGLFTVQGGAIDSIVIRSAANNGGFAYRSNPLTITTDTTIALFAAGYDAQGNYISDTTVTWSSTGLTGVPTGPSSSIVFNPTKVESGQIFTVTGVGVKDDTTALITIQAGAITDIRIQNSATGSGVEVDTVNLRAGGDTTLYVGGYDNDNNFVSTVSSNWSLEGNSIGTFSQTNPSTFNLLTVDSVGTAVVRATQNGGSLTDITSTITVLASRPDSLVKFASVDSQSAPVSSQLPKEITVKVLDAYLNPVPNHTVNFVPLAGGTVSQSTATTNELGIASTSWTVHSTPTTDSLAVFVAETTRPDTVIYYALVTAGSASSLSVVQPDTGTGVVDTDLGVDFTVLVQDSIGNPVPGLPISFAIISHPIGAEFHTLSVFSDTTNKSGNAATRLHLGSKVGTYIVRASTASTTPNFVDFYGIATADTASSISITFGNSQTDTVTQQLQDSIKFKVVDRFNNAISNQTVVFNPLNGSVNPTTAVSNASGVVATSWTLGTSSGTQQLVASLQSSPTVTSDTVTATALPDIGNTLTLVSLRKVARDSIAAVQGENVTAILEVQDQYGNTTPNQVVKFQPLPGYNVLFESSQVVSDNNGRVSNVVKTDPDSNKTLFRATINGRDTLNLHIFHLIYQNGSLTPISASPGDTVAYQLQVQNSSPIPVVLDTASTRLRYSDGTSTFVAALNGALTLPASSSDTLKFDPAVIPQNITPTSYTPELIIKGGGVDSLLSGTIILPINSLSVFKVNITQITSTVTQVARGDTFAVTVFVNNLGPDTVRVDSIKLSSSVVPQSNFIRVTPLGNLLPNSVNNQFVFQVIIPSGAPLGADTINAQFFGTDQNGTTVFDSQADTPLTYTIKASAQLSITSITPLSVTSTDTFTFQAKILNTGQFTAVLDKDSTTLTFGSDVIPLSQGFSVPPGSLPTDAVTVSFAAHGITSAASLTKYPASIRLYGTENSGSIDTTITLGDSILVQNPPNVVVTLLNVVPDSASQNQDTVLTRLILTNSGALNASAVISSPDSIALSTNVLSGITPANNSQSLFPITLQGDSSTQVIDFVHGLTGSYPTGLDTVQVAYSYRDNNSNRLYQVTPANIDSYQVLSRSQLTLIAGSDTLSPDTVVQGQGGVRLVFSVRNDGEAPAIIGASDVSVQFNNNHTINLVSPTLPDTLPFLATRQFVYDITTASDAAIGIDPLDVTVAYTDTFSGKHYTDLTANNLDTLTIVTGADTQNVQIQFVDITPTRANQGQGGIGARVRLKNLSQSTIRIDTLFLQPSRGGVQQTLNTTLGNISPGAQQTFQFTLAVDDTTSPGSISFDAAYGATDLTSGTTFADTGALVLDTLDIRIPANFRFTPVTINPDTVSEGQTNVLVTTTLINGDNNTSDAQVTGLQLLFSVGGTNMTTTLQTPSPLPLLPGGDSVLVSFAMDIADPSTYHGVVNVDVTATGVDQTDSGSFSDTTTTPTSFLIQSKGQIVVDSVRSTVAQAVPGQTGIPVTVYFHNPGQASVDIDLANSSLYFNGSTTYFSQSFDSLSSDPLIGGAIDTAYFTVNVLNNALPGAYAVSAKITGQETNLNAVVSDSASTVTEIDSLLIVTPGDLRLLSVTTNFDSVSIGSQGVGVTARVRNNGNATLKIDSLKLTFTRGTYLFTDTTFTPPVLLTSGATLTVPFSVSVPGSNTPQPQVVIDGEVYGVDLVSGEILQDVDADTVDVWQLVTPAAFNLVSITPDSVSNGQLVSFTLQVANTGQANARLSSTQTVLQLNDNSDTDQVQVSLGQNTLIGGNSTVALTFPAAKVDNFTPGVLPANLYLTNYSENGFTRSDTLTSNAIQVFDSASVIITSLLAPDTISQDMNLNIQLDLLNNGSTNSPAVIDSVVISTFGYQQSVNSSLVGDSTLRLNLTPLVDTTYSGVVNYQVDVYWHDAFLGHSNTTSALKSVTVLKKANLIVTSITHPTAVTTGQSNIPVSITVQNTGEVTALVDTITFLPSIGLYRVSPPTQFADIQPGNSQTYNFTLDVFGNSATGPDSITVSVSATDSISTNNVGVDSFYTWIIQGQSNVQIISTIPSQPFVSQGQQNVPVQVILKNFGGSTTRVDSVSLLFQNGNSNYSGFDTSNVGLLILSGDQDTLQLNVDVNPTAITGVDVIDAMAIVTDLVSGAPDTIHIANSQGSWTVQQRPTITVPLLNVNADTVSTGEQNLVLNFHLGNLGGNTPTATAIIDSVHLVINGNENDSSNFSFTPNFNLPVNIANNSTLTFDYDLDVRTNALSGLYTFAATVYYRDSNDGGAFNLPFGSSATDDVLVQQKALLTVTKMMVQPDSAVTGQSNVAVTIRAKNTGEAAANLISSNILQHNSNFTVSLQTIGFPFTLQQNDSVDILYFVNVPNITLNGADSLIHFGATLQGTDKNSGTSITNQQDSLSTLTVVEPAHVSFDSLLSPVSYTLGDTAQIAVRVFNDGGGTLQLSGATQIRLEKINDPTTIITIPIDTTLSGLKLASGDTVSVISNPLVVTKSGTFRIYLDISGIVYQQPYSQEINTLTNINVGGAVFINQVSIDDVDGQVFPGQDSVNLFVKIINNSLTATIDTATITFNYVDNGQQLGVVPIRVDTVTQVPPGANGVTLQWYFNVPFSRTGDIRITANVSLNGGTINIFDNSTIFSIVSGIQLSYLSGSLAPDTVVQGESVAFRATFLNSGNTTLLVNPDSSFLNFTDGANHTFKAFVDGNFSILGTSDSIPDSSVITFKVNSVDPAFLTGLYPVDFTLRGNLPNGETYQGFTHTATNEVRVIQEASLVVDSIDIVPSAVVAGQNNVAVRYYLRNTGTSTGEVTSASSLFFTDMDSAITNQWTQVQQSHTPPFMIQGGDTALMIRRFNVASTIDTGVVRGRMTLSYHDVLKPADVKTFNQPAIYDSVRVVQPSSIRIDSLQLAGVPNAQNGTVNYGQNYNLRILLRNNGSDDLHQIDIELLANEVPILRDTLASVLPGGGTLETFYPFTAGNTSQTINYRVVLREAVSMISGNPVTIDQPLDNLENVTIQEPRTLSLSATASGDSSYSIGQTFSVSFDITTTGESPFGTGEVMIHLPSNYALAPATPDSQITISQTNLTGTWQVIAVDTTVGANDIITVDYSVIPTDLNTNNPVNTTNTQVDIPVLTVPSAIIRVASIQITSPPGATDDTLSTGQTFVLKSNFNFIGNVAPENRRAQLVLPSGFFTNDSLIQTISGDSSVWTITIDDNLLQSQPATPSGKKNKGIGFNGGGINPEIQQLLGQLFTFQVKASAKDGNSQVPIADSLTHSVEVVQGATMVVHAAISDPPGARLGTISTSQTFEVQVWVENVGEAGVETNSLNYLTLTVPSGFTVEGHPPGEAHNFTLLTGQSSATVIRVTAPDSVPQQQTIIEARLDSAAFDENSNQRAAIQTGVTPLNVVVEERATLSIDNLNSDIDPLARDQIFNIQAQVANSGDANVEPGDTVFVILDVDTTVFQILNPATSLQAVKLVNKQASVGWQLKTRAGAPFGSYAIVTRIVDSLSYDEHNYPDSSVYTLKPTDTLQIDVVDVGQINITETYLNRPGVDSLIAGTKQSIQAVVKAAFTGNIANRQATLILPDIFTLDSLTVPFTGDSVVWNLQIPDSVTNGYVPLTVIVRGTSQVNGQPLSATGSVYLRVKKRATLVVDGQITSGAVNNTVSYGQEFVYEAVVNNVGEIGIRTGSPAQLTVAFGDSIQLVQGEVATQDFQLNQPVSWHFRVLDNPKWAAITGEIHTLENEKKQLLKRIKTIRAHTQAVAPEMVEEQINQLQKQMNQVDGELNKLYGQFAGIIDSSFVKVQITTIPLDSSSLTPADTAVGSDITRVYIAEQPAINITDVQMPTVWSTHQTGQVQLLISNPSNVVNRSARLVLPPGFTYSDPGDSVKFFGQANTVSWTINAPPTINQGTITETLRFDVRGNDQFNDTVLVQQTLDTTITIQQEAQLDLRLANGATIATRQVSKNKEFTIRARIQRQGTAGMNGNTRVRLYDPTGEFEFVDNDSIKVFDNISNSVEFTWRLIAPGININSAILGIGFVQLPVDVNTSQPVSLLNDSITVVVNLVSNRLQVDTFLVDRPSNNFVQGTPDVPVYGLMVHNPNAFDQIFVNGFKMSVREDPNDSLVIDYQNLIRRVRVVSARYYYTQLAKVGTRDILGEVSMDTASNPFTIKFTPPDTSVAGETDSVIVLIDLGSQALNRKFFLRLESVDAFQVVEGDIVDVEVVDFNGVPIEGFISKFTSAPLTVLSSDPQKIFGNYPNPFGLDTKIPGAPRGTTRFTFNMKDDGDAELRIYTLLGELVWSSGVISNLARGSHTGNELLWDGRNGEGRHVVNGVYVAVLRLNYKNGQSEVFKTKVVYIK